MSSLAGLESSPARNPKRPARLARCGLTRRTKALILNGLSSAASLPGIKLLLCENPLPPIDEVIASAQAEAAHSNYYTEPYSAPLRQLISARLGVPERLVHINASSELILRQLFDRFGQQVHLLTPTYVLFPEVAQRYTEQRLPPDPPPTTGTL